MKIFYMNLSTGQISESQTTTCSTPVAGQIHNFGSYCCSLAGCNFLIITPAALLQAIETTAGKLAMENAITDCLKQTKRREIPPAIQKHWIPAAHIMTMPAIPVTERRRRRRINEQ